MKKIAIILIALITLSSCQDLTELNVAPKQAKDATAQALFANAQKSLASTMASTNVNLNIFRMLAQQWTETTYTDEARYDLSTRNIPQNFWNSLYRDVLRDLKESRTIVSDIDPLFIDEDLRQNELAMIDVMEVYTNMVLVLTFGDIPYTEALNSDDLQPTYDDAATIYADLVQRLNADIATFGNTGAAGFGDFESSDLIYGGDLDSWLMFGNSLKLKLGMILADVDEPTAQTIVESAAPGVFTSNEDNATFQFLSAPPNTNPLWVDLVQSGRKDFVAANTLVDEMVALDDPRIPVYFTEDKVGSYSGGTYGSSNSYSTFSKPGELLIEPELAHIFMDYAEVEFDLAEAVERGWSVGVESAEDHYVNAITASMEYWGVDDAAIADYLAQPEVAYATATGTYKEKIGMQKWLALYNRGFDAWTEWRRLDAPVLVAPANALSGIPVRLTYPVQEQNLNSANYTNAAAAVGGDMVETPLFWDVN